MNLSSSKKQKNTKNSPLKQNAEKSIFFKKNSDQVSLQNSHHRLDTKRLSDENLVIFQDDGFETIQQNQENNENEQNEESQRPSKLKRQSRIIEESIRKKFEFVILPTQKWKQMWDIIIFGVLIYVCILTPYKMTFIDDDDFPIWDALDSSIDYIFMADIVLTFFCAYYDSENNLITNQIQIIKNYLQSFFIIDLLSCMPLQYLFGVNNKQNNIARISKLPKLYRLIKMFKLVRILQLKDDVRIININIGSERFLYSLLFLLLSCHVTGCIWFFIASISENSDWEYNYLSTYDQYVTSLYWTVQTVLTVGYGDIKVNQWPSYLFAIIWMLISVYIFSFAVGSLASFLDRMDHANTLYMTRLNILKTIKKEFRIPNQIFFKVKRELKQKGVLSQQQYSDFLDQLPPQLRIELSYIMNKQLQNEIPYFENQPPTFIASIGPLLTPLKVDAHACMFATGDMAEEIYFLKSGKLAFVITENSNFKFLMIKQGSYFGEVDILFYGEKRKYTVLTTKKCEFYVLQKKHFKYIYFNQFREEGAKLIKEASKRKVLIKQSYEAAINFLEEQGRKQYIPTSQRVSLKHMNSISSSKSPQESLTNQRLQLENVIQEENEEEEADAMMSLMDKQQFKKKIQQLEKQIQVKDTTILAIQQELEELTAEIQLKNLEVDRLAIPKTFEERMQFIRFLKADHHMRLKKQQTQHMQFTFNKQDTMDLKKCNSLSPLRNEDFELD